MFVNKHRHRWYTSFTPNPRCQAERAVVVAHLQRRKSKIRRELDSASVRTRGTGTGWNVKCLPVRACLSADWPASVGRMSTAPVTGSPGAGLNSPSLGTLLGVLCSWCTLALWYFRANSVKVEWQRQRRTAEDIRDVFDPTALNKHFIFSPNCGVTTQLGFFVAACRSCDLSQKCRLSAKAP